MHAQSNMLWKLGMLSEANDLKIPEECKYVSKSGDNFII